MSDFWETSVAAFLRELRTRGYAERTTVNYGASLSRFGSWMWSYRGYGSLSDIGREDLLEYCQDLTLAKNRRGRPWSSTTKNGHLNGLRAFFAYAVRVGLLLSNPASELSNFRGQKKLPRVPSFEEILKLLAAVDIGTAKGLRDRSWMEILYGSGLRLGELLRLELQDLCLEDNLLHIREGKGRKDRFVPLTPEAVKSLREYLGFSRSRLDQTDCPSLFVSTRGGQMNRYSVSSGLHFYAKRAGLKVRITPHILRHSCATHLLKNGASLRHIQLLLGHAFLSTTQLYTHIEITDLREVLRKCHPRENFDES